MIDDRIAQAKPHTTCLGQLLQEMKNITGHWHWDVFLKFLFCRLVVRKRASGTVASVLPGSAETMRK